jgi:2-polyprenyl-3-methyl-5-hydroxy-6-metoxy-1,4-benzoquinol methylase
MTMGAQGQLPLRKLESLRWTDELAHRFWNDLAGSEYLEQIAFSKFASGLLVDLAQPYLRQASRILDYGAGDNLYLVRELLRRGYLVSALEPNAVVRERNADLAQLANFQGTVAEVSSAAFDCIFLSEVIEHLSESALSGAMQSIVSGLASNGLLVVTTPDNENLLEASRYCPTCRQLFHPWGHVRSYSARQLEQTLADFGFACLELRSVDFSSNRETAVELGTTRAVLRTLATRLSEIAASADAGGSSRLKTVLGSILDAAERRAKTLPGAILDVAEQLRQLAGPAPEGDPKRMSIGDGGTLVAIAQLA